MNEDPGHMSDDPGHEPEHVDDKRFAPVTRDEDARGRTPDARPGEETGGTGMPGVKRRHPDTLPPTEEGVEHAERTDHSRRPPSQPL
ncbi:hypothetical protein [Actinomadura gamaensis]|uniref:Uncharacterized protein n=1 Tax=Actinomadura gamaensis TaxID=1763541 RepID=A0ABV9U7D3_9ACTN